MDDDTTNEITVVNISMERLELLEERELESTQGQLVPVDYCEMLALYIYHGDLCSSKYLWKRIPLNFKNDSAELRALWEIGKSFWKKDYPAVYQSCKAYAWSQLLQGIIDALLIKTNLEILELISEAYINISLTSFCNLLSCNTEEAKEKLSKLDWRLSDDKKTVFPKKKPKSTGSSLNSEAHLQKLTEYISFLET